MLRTWSNAQYFLWNSNIKIQEEGKGLPLDSEYDPGIHADLKSHGRQNITADRRREHFLLNSYYCFQVPPEFNVFSHSVGGLMLEGETHRYVTEACGLLPVGKGVDVFKGKPFGVLKPGLR